MKPKFRLSTMLWLTVVVAGICGWWLDHWRLATPLFQARVQLLPQEAALNATLASRDHLSVMLDDHRTRLQVMRKEVSKLGREVESLKATAE